MNILVTGGAGFIGSTICERLLSLGHKVIALDNLSSGHMDNIKPFMDNPLFTFIKGDVSNFETCLTLSVGMDVIIHEAALVSVPKSIEEPILNHSSTLTGMVNVLESARINGVKRIVYASSAATYGLDDHYPKVEEHTSDALSPYALAKYVDELYAKLYFELYGVSSVGLRYFNVYGPKQDPSSPYSGVISIFIDKVVSNQPITIYGDGSNTRDFVYVEDVVDANILAFESNSQGAFVYNVGTEIETSVLELAKLVLKTTNKKIDILFKDARSGDIAKSVASISKIKKDLGFTPRIRLNEGLSNTIKWYLSNQNKQQH
ncbi:MAG TPA: SDR family oxidoreductase [Bacilli bacterium]|nr:SDR family oxidoreductase [Bacilli bacterium]